MCLMCVEIANSRMTFPEARNALPELIRAEASPEELAHYKELQEADDEKLRELAQAAAKKISQR